MNRQRIISMKVPSRRVYLVIKSLWKKLQNFVRQMTKKKKKVYFRLKSLIDYSQKHKQIYIFLYRGITLNNYCYFYKEVRLLLIFLWFCIMLESTMIFFNCKAALWWKVWWVRGNFFLDYYWWDHYSYFLWDCNNKIIG